MMPQEGALLCRRYRLVKLIGRGGMADVYLAFDDRRQAQVAIKVLREDLAEDPDFVRRFRREAQALAQLDHPNIVRFYAFEQDGPVALIVMDYIPGTTLRRRLLEHSAPLPIETITAILRDLCSALHYAHINGFVHRDVKPGNVMLRPDGTAMLTDFGISRVAEGTTLTIATLGSPAYMSPEQITGDEVDMRSDIYSLGVMLFEMATGVRPFTGDEPELTESSTTSRIREAHLRLAPPEPRQLNPLLPAAASQVILRALAKRPADRWPDAVSLRTAWEAAVAAAPAGAEKEKRKPRETTDDRRWKPAVVARQPRALRRWPILAVLVVVALLAIGSILALGIPGGEEAGSKSRTEIAALTSPTATATVATVPPSAAATFTRPATTAAKGVVQVMRAPTAQFDVRPTVTPTLAVRTATATIFVPTPIPTFTPEPTSAPIIARTNTTVRPSPAITARSTTGGVELLQPPENEKIVDGATFSWRPTADFRLGPGEWYELIVWGEGEDPMRDGRSPTGATPETRVTANLAGVEAILRLSPGKTYLWGVRLLGPDRKSPIRMLSDARRFVYERSGSGSTPGGVKAPDE